MIRMKRTAPTISLLMLLLVGCSSMKPGSLDVIASSTDTRTSRVGTVLLLRGWIGIFSTGMDSLGTKVNEAGMQGEVYQTDQWASMATTLRATYKELDVHEPLVLVGHSYGADDVIRIARELNKDNIQIDLLITLDPVTPPLVPGNVKHAYNLYQSNGAFDSLPWLRGIPLEKEPGSTGRVDNLDLRTDRTDLLEPGLDHFNIEKKQKIHDEVLARLKDVCIPRAVWQAKQDRARAARQASLVTPDDGS